MLDASQDLVLLLPQMVGGKDRVGFEVRLSAQLGQESGQLHVAGGAGVPKSFKLSGGSGKPNEVFFCDRCGTYLWSKYYASPGDTVLLRVGTLDRPEAIKPDVHIFTRSKLPWLDLPKEVPALIRFMTSSRFGQQRAWNGCVAMQPSRLDWGGDEFGPSSYSRRARFGMTRVKYMSRSNEGG